MSLRDLVAGSDMCTPSDGGAGPSNAMGSLVNTLLGGAGKTQEQLRELPGMPGGAGSSTAFMPPNPAALAMAAAGSMAIPGMMAGPSVMSQNGLDAFFQATHQPQAAGAVPSEWDQIFQQQQQGQLRPGSVLPPPAPGMLAPGPPAAGLASQFQAFLSSARSHSHFAAGPVAPEVLSQLSVADKVRIRNRSTIMARHIYADMGDQFADQQVSHLLASLHIDPRELPAQLTHVHDAAWHDAWGQASAGRPMPQPSVSAELAQAAHGQWDDIWAGGRHGAVAGPPAQRAPSTGWAMEFAEQQQQHRQANAGPAAEGAPAAWAQEFTATEGNAGWASEFAQEQASASGQQQGQQAGGRATADARASTAALVDVLSRDADPKMRNSKFLQFVSKMSKGELILDDNKVVAASPQAASWAAEFGQQQAQAGPSHRAAPAGPAGLAGDWADEFARGVADLKLDEGLPPGVAATFEEAWRDQETRSWVQEFNQGSDEAFSEWERIYGHGAVETSAGAAIPSTSEAARGEYVFAANNPFRGDPEALSKGKDLFRRGVLTEAALALEAEVQAHPDNAEAWRLLGTVHAENDDDRQAIAAMMRAHKADPRDPAVLLALGVSFTNELDQWEAVSHLRGWMAAHPDFAALERRAGEALDSSQRLVHVIRMFESATTQAPNEAELYMALGVLHHLGRNYNKAVDAFQRALQLRPNDYSLWNKLGATLANNARSGEALGAYQKALDLKPNYMRAWTNMGIGYANLGDYERSARFYVRALGLNASADHVWGYLRTSLACAGRLELMSAVDKHDLPSLQAALPLE